MSESAENEEIEKHLKAAMKAVAADERLNAYDSILLAYRGVEEWLPTDDGEAIREFEK